MRKSRCAEAYIMGAIFLDSEAFSNSEAIRLLTADAGEVLLRSPLKSP